MNFYDYIHILCYLCIYSAAHAGGSRNPHVRVVRAGVAAVSPAAAGIIFNVEVNNTSDAQDYEVELSGEQCCLEHGSTLDCDLFEILGRCVGTLPRGTRATFKLVAPITDPYERKGYCIAYLDSKTARTKVMRDLVRIPFDTKLKNYKDEELPQGVRRCKLLDEDPLNNCKPVDCAVFYNGKKSFYNKVHKRCVEVPPCISHNHDLPDTIYDPNNNRCIVDGPLVKEDFDYLKRLVNRKTRVPKDVYIIRKHMETKTPDPSASHFKVFMQKCWDGIGLLYLIIFIQCGILAAILSWFCGKSKCASAGKVSLVDKFFNYQADGSSTPLISVGKTGTETTCHFTSESSHIDKKIQCYKSCQKDNNTKTSLSDDILTKYLNRREWVESKKQVKSESIEVKPKEPDDRKTFETRFVGTNKSTKTESNKIVKPVKSIVKVTEETRKIIDNNSDISISPVSEHFIREVSYSRDNTHNERNSEEEIKCHSYNLGIDKKSSIDSFGSVSRTALHNKNNKKVSCSRTVLRNQHSAQVCFSNDSIDDYLSERGIHDLNDDLSRYSLSDASVRTSRSSETSRTSKNNILKRVMSCLKRGKPGPSSDPGEAGEAGEGASCGRKDSVNLELIHMSKATMYSSSNNGTDCKNFRVKDSRSSL